MRPGEGSQKIKSRGLIQKAAAPYNDDCPLGKTNEVTEEKRTR